MNSRQRLWCVAQARLWRKQNTQYFSPQVSRLVWEALKLRWTAQQIPSFALEIESVQQSNVIRKILSPLLGEDDILRFEHEKEIDKIKKNVK